MKLSVDGHLIPGGNKQAVDRLDEPVIKPAVASASATQPQPASAFNAAASSDLPEYPVLVEKKFGVSDGSRNASDSTQNEEDQ